MISSSSACRRMASASSDSSASVEVVERRDQVSDLEVSEGEVERDAVGLRGEGGLTRLQLEEDGELVDCLSAIKSEGEEG